MKDSAPLLLKASENIDAADLLLREGYFDITASRSYYAMFYIAEALLLTRDMSFSSHSAVIAAFGKEFAKTKQVSPEHHRRLREAFDARQVSDYSYEYPVSREKAEQILGWAEEFLAAARDFLRDL